MALTWSSDPPATRTALAARWRSLPVGDREAVGAGPHPAAALVCLLGPLLFGRRPAVSSTVPADTLFGRWVGDSGYAIPLVVLGFAGSWGFPLVVCLVAGDIFSAEDHYQTWASILTRSISRRGVFAGKVLATSTYAVAALVLLA